ncbi:twin-arginine translocation signal domain-containing protein [Candidatus Pacearchaeota archaeon]|nr:twin-arginine translocation signal domain-containing protein [Candidatus Pacearchaeota archaeon]
MNRREFIQTCSAIIGGVGIGNCKVFLSPKTIWHVSAAGPASDWKDCPRTSLYEFDVSDRGSMEVGGVIHIRVDDNLSVCKIIRLELRRA